MKIISEKTNKEYDCVEACLADEAKFDKMREAEEQKKKELAATRKARAAEVEDAYKAILDAQKAYREKLNNFIEDYGSFHMTVRKENNTYSDLLDSFFNWI